MRQRKMENYVYSIKDEDGKMVEGFEGVAHLVTTYHEKLLGKQTPKRKELDCMIIEEGNVLNFEQQLKLMAPFSEQDIKETMF